MGQMTTLAEVVRSLRQLDPDLTIFAAEPWTGSSAAAVERGSVRGGPPEAAVRAGLAYFLEVHIAREVVDDWNGYMEGKASDEDLCDRLISYAVNDA